MTFKSGLKTTFNWLAERPKHNYTLAGAFQHYVQRKPWDQVNSNPLGYSRGGRAIERAVMALGFANLAIGITWTGGALLPAVGLAAWLLSDAKVGGIIGAKAFDGVSKYMRDPAPPSKSIFKSIFKYAKEDRAESKRLLEQARKKKQPKSTRSFDI